MRWLVRVVAPLLLVLVGCATGSPPAEPDEWQQLQDDHRALLSLRESLPTPPESGSRREQIEILLENHRKIEPVWVPFMERLRSYHEATGDPRAGSLYAREKMMLGDIYMEVLSRYDEAVEMYRGALEIDPENRDLVEKIRRAEERRFVRAETFGQIRAGMSEAAVQKVLARPREDWIRQVVQNGRTYSVWIYPKSDGGAAAVYFDNGVVYHTNWAAAPAAP